LAASPALADLLAGSMRRHGLKNLHPITQSARLVAHDGVVEQVVTTLSTTMRFSRGVATDVSKDLARTPTHAVCLENLACGGIRLFPLPSGTWTWGRSDNASACATAARAARWQRWGIPLGCLGRILCWGAIVALVVTFGAWSLTTPAPSRAGALSAFARNAPLIKDDPDVRKAMLKAAATGGIPPELREKIEPYSRRFIDQINGEYDYFEASPSRLVAAMATANRRAKQRVGYALMLFLGGFALRIVSRLCRRWTEPCTGGLSYSAADVLWVRPPPVVAAGASHELTPEEAQFIQRGAFASIPPAPGTFHPELFDIRAQVIAKLATAGFLGMTDFSSVDLLHEEFGVEVSGILDLESAKKMQLLLCDLLPDWPYTSAHYIDYGIEPGWVIEITRDPTPPDYRAGHST
jgi:hypothetical protein